MNTIFKRPSKVGMQQINQNSEHLLKFMDETHLALLFEYFTMNGTWVGNTIFTYVQC